MRIQIKNRDRGLSEELRRAAESRSSRECELRRTAEALAESQHANCSLRASWSWRLTAPLRWLVDAVGRLRGLRAAPIRSGVVSGVVQWLLFGHDVRESGLFDEHYYLERYRGVAQGRINPLFHYFVFGGAEERQPNFLFDTGYYLAHNPDVAASRVNPLVHYLKWGGYEGRNPHPHFDSAYYLEQNPDVRELGLNPLAHYLGPGTPEGRKPNRWFDPAAYLDQHPHVAVSAPNPLVHYLMAKRDAPWHSSEIPGV